MKSPAAPQRNRRLAVLAVLLTFGAGLIALLWRDRPAPPLRSSLATPFQLLGTPLHLGDRLASKALPVGDVDEEALGEVLRKRFEAQVRPGEPDQHYLDALMVSLTPHIQRPFRYRAYAIGSCGTANAWALPGGVILVCAELLELLDSEAALVSVLAHELGHVELGHCFARVRFELLSRRLGGSRTLAQLADGAVALLLQRPYSKAAEHEADDYAQALLQASDYDPAAQGQAFAALNAAHGGSRPRADLILDGLDTHPPGPLRRGEYEQRAAAWWRRNPGARRYVGRRNLRDRRSLAEWPLAGEWVGAGAADSQLDQAAR